MDDKRRWLPSWPPHKDVKADPKANKNTEEDKRYNTLPAAIDITVQHAIYGQIITTLPLVTYKADENIDKDKEETSKK